jgi:hypothetical protein
MTKRSPATPRIPVSTGAPVSFRRKTRNLLTALRGPHESFETNPRVKASGNRLHGEPRSGQGLAAASTTVPA